jgi:hypothetical protein
MEVEGAAFFCHEPALVKAEAVCARQPQSSGKRSAHYVRSPQLFQRTLQFSRCEPRECCTAVRAMAKTYRHYVPEQDLLLPPSLREWLPEDHLAYLASDLVDHLVCRRSRRSMKMRSGLSAVPLDHADEGAGVRLLRRRLLVAEEFSADWSKTWSSACWPRAMNRTFGRSPIWKTHLTALKSFFEQVLRLARELGAPRRRAVGGTATARESIEADSRSPTGAGGAREG